MVSDDDGDSGVDLDRARERLHRLLTRLDIEIDSISVGLEGQEEMDKIDAARRLGRLEAMANLFDDIVKDDDS